LVPAPLLQPDNCNAPGEPAIVFTVFVAMSSLRMCLSALDKTRKNVSSGEIKYNPVFSEPMSVKIPSEDPNATLSPNIEVTTAPGSVTFKILLVFANEM
jgi:hypothetical protein